MKKSTSRTPNATIGTCTADLGERDKFVGDENKMKLYKDPDEGRWYAMATHNVKEDELRFYDLDLIIPFDGNVENKDYEIDDDFANPKTVKAIFWKRNGPGVEAFIAKTGRLTCTIDESTEQATATFEFKTKNLDVIVTEGVFDLEGFDPSLTGPMDLKASGDFTAAIQDGEITKDYSASELALSWQHGNDTNFPAPHWWAWSKQSGSPNVVIALFIADTLEINKKYTLTRDSAEVRAMYIDFDPSGIRSHVSIDGTLILTSVPPQGSSTGVLTGTINFEAEHSDGAKTIEVENGVFNFNGTKH